MSVETISLCVVALNEESCLPGLLEDFLAQTYPRELTEVVLVDSGSQDGTRAIMEAFAQEYGEAFLSVKVGDNPKVSQAAGWNRAIALSTGDVIARIDAHTHIPVDFAQKNMLLQQQGEYITGGICPGICQDGTPWQKTLLQAENSMFGSSVNISRRGTRKQYVKTVSLPAYRREVLDKVGPFNEELLRTEDNELSYRICQAGYRICYDPEISSSRFVRSSLRKMLRQKYGNGYWIGYTLFVCPGCVSAFYLVPLAFVLGIVLTTALALMGHPLLAYLMWAAYGVVAVGFAAVGIRKFSPWDLLLPVLFLLMHVSYGIGTAMGIGKQLWMRITGKRTAVQGDAQ